MTSISPHVFHAPECGLRLQGQVPNASSCSGFLSGCHFICQFLRAWQQVNWLLESLPVSERFFAAAVATSSVKQERTSERRHELARRQVKWRCRLAVCGFRGACAAAVDITRQSFVRGLLPVCDRNTVLDHLLMDSNEQCRNGLTGCSSGVDLPPFPERRCISSPQQCQALWFVAMDQRRPSARNLRSC